MVKADREYLAVFESAKDFEKAFTNRGSETGIFFPTTRPIPVGEQVWIRCSIKGIPAPLFLEGRIVWRRIRPGGPKLPAGTFVGLVERERAHLDAIIRYIHAGGTRKERRMHPRYPIYFTATYSTSKGDFSSDTRNLSRSGVYLRCTGPLMSVGARFPLVVFPNGKRAQGLALDAQVAWIDLFEETKGMGVVFIRGQSMLKKVAQLVDEFEADIKK